MSEYSIALEKQMELNRFIKDNGEHLFALAGKSGVEEKMVRCVLSLTGEAFYWDSRIIPLIERAADVIPSWTLGAHMLEGDAGFWWFPTPLSMPTWDGHDANICAISWQRKVIDSTSNKRGIDFYGWADLEDSPTVPIMAMTWMPDESWTEVLRLRQEPLYPDMSESPPPEAYTESDARDERFLRLLSASIAFLDQRILAPRAAPLDRADRRRVERMGHEPLVRVVELRKRESHHNTAEGSERDYSCQWLVRGHWRQQWYPKLNRHQPKWITPYVKGPPEKPLKQPRATVFAVVR